MVSSEVTVSAMARMFPMSLVSHCREYDSMTYAFKQTYTARRTT